MINISVINKHAFIFDIEDWKKLRTDYRIIGDLCGVSQYMPTLPLSLMPEEVALLVTKGFANLIRYEAIKKFPSDQVKELHKKDLNLLLHHENIVYKNIRREQLEPIIDKIIEGKRKKGTINDEITREDALEDEVNKSSELTLDNMIVPTILQHPKELKGEAVPVRIEEILKQDDLQATRISVFQDLWEKGLYITSGYKFGGDFLCYAGDPLVYHAMYIIRCVKITTVLDLTEIISLGRLGTSVKKKAVFAFVSNECVKYVTIAWCDV